jgi:hypothetical protein
MFPWRVLPLLVLMVSTPMPASAACWLIAPADREVRMPAVQVFLSVDEHGTETLIVQPEFDSTSDNIGVIVATPKKPEVAAVPRDFFAALGRLTQLKRRVFPESRLLPLDDVRQPTPGAGLEVRRPQRIRVLEENLADTEPFRIASANEFFALVEWMKTNEFPVDLNVIDPLVDRNWFFAFAKVNPKQLRKDRDGRFRGAVAPFRITFATDKLLLPMGLARSSAAERIDLRCYVQADGKVDLPVKRSYQYHWVPFLQSVVGEWPRGVVPGKGNDWLKALQADGPAIVKKGKELGFGFTSGPRPTANKQDRVATTLEWAKRLADADLLVLKGTVPASEPVPDPDDGFSEADLRQPQRADAIRRAIRKRLEGYRKDRPDGYLVRDISPADAPGLKELSAYLKPGRFLTRLYAGLTRDEVKDHMILVPARWGTLEDTSEYDERLQRKEE